MILLWLMRKWNETSRKTNDLQLKPVYKQTPSEHDDLLEMSRWAIPMCLVGSVVIALMTGLLLSLSRDTAGWILPVTFVTVLLGIGLGMAGNIIFSRMYFERKYPPKK
jgi:hypothetical protein